MRGLQPTRFPQPLPRSLLSELALARGLGLFLDFDGTISEIAGTPEGAVPLPGVMAMINELAGQRAIRVAIVSGRRVVDLRRVLRPAPSVILSGVHGLEFCADGEIEIDGAARECLLDIDRARRWLENHVPRGRGFVVEDKLLAVGLHYRGANPLEARVLCARFANFIATEARRLSLLDLKKLLEVVPRDAGKDRAVERLKYLIPSSFGAAYFGDDLTDDAAFAALGDRDVAVLVGEPRECPARYRVASPHDVAAQLELLVDALRRSPRSSAVR